MTISAWEIECCAPPTVVGQITTWTLAFDPVSEPDRYWLPPALTNLQWHVEKWPTPDGPHPILTRGGITAPLAAENSHGLVQLPESGHHRLPGCISGGKHGGRGELDDFPTTTAQVRFLDVITVTHTLNNDQRTLTPVDRSYQLFPTRRSPRWFTHNIRTSHGQPATDDVGLDMIVVSSPVVAVGDGTALTASFRP